ncbi:hypothetical protein LTR28_012336, partial [Elasticomyces elasticus]
SESVPRRLPELHPHICTWRINRRWSRHCVFFTRTGRAVTDNLTSCILRPCGICNLEKQRTSDQSLHLHTAGSYVV